MLACDLPAERPGSTLLREPDMKKLLAGLVSLILAGCTAMVMMENPPEQDLPGTIEEPTQEAEPMDAQPSLKNLGPAPELENEIWLNTDAPLRLSDLRGKVVLLDMWTFG
jgi:hypothetical protein